MARPTRTPGLPRQVKAAVVTLVIAFCIGVILGLVSDVERRLDALARASSDSVQWSLAQLEVETQLMREALAAPDADLAEVRKRFDIFYSRVVIFETSALYAGLRERPEFEDRTGRCRRVRDAGASPHGRAGRPAARGVADHLRRRPPICAAQCAAWP